MNVCNIQGRGVTSTVYCAQMTGVITPKWGFVSTAHTTPARKAQRG